MNITIFIFPFRFYDSKISGINIFLIRLILFIQNVFISKDFKKIITVRTNGAVEMTRLYIEGDMTEAAE